MSAAPVTRVPDELAPVQVVNRPLTVEAIKEQVRTITRILKDVMIEGTHYGTIKGTQKPSLWKPGAEKLAATFQIRPQVQVEDLSRDGEIEYRVKVVALSSSGIFLGEGVGHYSTKMTKYKWREATCREEFDDAAEGHRRIHWKMRDDRAVAIFQVRQEPADLANTILKMAKKSALIDAILTVTAASDIFDQDLDDDDKSSRGDPGERNDEPQSRRDPPRRTEPARRSRQQTTQRKPQSAAANGPPPDVISEAQRKRFFAIWKNAQKTEKQVKTYLREEHGIDTSHHIRRDVYQDICAWAEDTSNNWTDE